MLTADDLPDGYLTLPDEAFVEVPVMCDRCGSTVPVYAPAISLHEKFHRRADPMFAPDEGDELGDAVDADAMRHALSDFLQDGEDVDIPVFDPYGKIADA